MSSLLKRGNGRCGLWTAVLFAALVLLTLVVAIVFETPAASADAACDAKPPGLIGWAHSLTGDALRLDVKDNYVYLVDGPGNLQVFDISNPCNPVSIGFNNTSNASQEFTDVKLIGDYAYVANDDRGVAKFVATDPSDPNFLKLVSVVKGGQTYAMGVSYAGGQYAFVPMKYGYPAKLIVYDLTDFTVEQIYEMEPESDHMWESDAVGDRVYLSASALFRILDVSGLPDMPVAKGSLGLGWADYGGPFSVKVVGDYAYLGFSEHVWHDGGLVIVNIADEMNPTVEGAAFIPGSSNALVPPALGIAGDMVYMTGVDYLYGFDVSDPSNPTQTIHYPFPVEFGSTTGGGALVRGNLAFAAVGRLGTSGHGGLAIYKLAAANSAPLAEDDDYSTNEDQALVVPVPGVLDNDSDPDSDPLTAVTVADPAHGSLTLNGDGSFSYTPTAGYVGADSFTYKANDGQAVSNLATVSIDVYYPFTGFFSPVDNLPTVNSAKAGSAIPIKFSLGGDYGLGIFAAGYPTVVRVACDTGTPADEIEETVTAGSSGLQYNPVTGQYTYVWKTTKTWARTCRQFELKLADGTSHTADFSFK